MQMNSHQQAVLNAVTSGGNVVVNAGPGTGKGLRSDQPVITPKGYVAIGNLKSGDLVYGPDGHTYPVVGVYHRGVLPLYEVKFNDGQSVITDGDHRWLCKTLRERKRDRPAVIRTTSELIKLGKNVFLPMPKPLLGNSVTRVIDPWLIGALLGDGGMSGTAVVFSNSEDSMLSAVRDTLPNPCQLKYIANYDWKISGNGKGSYNQVVDALRYLKLFGCRSHEKFIPEHLLNADVQTRTSILQGLLDTDGSTDGYAVEYCSSSKQLALDVIRIVESLGGLCTMKEKPSHYTKSDGSRVECKLSYRVSIRLPSTISPFKHSEKKLFRYVPKTKYQPARQIVSITSVDPGESICIEVGSPDHLFLTVGHAVTHNTYVLAGTANANQGKPIINFCFNRNTKLQADERMPSWVKNYTFHGAAYGQVGKYYQKQLNTKLSPRVISQHFDCDEKDATVVKYTLRKFATSDSNCITGWNVPFESFKGKPKPEQEQYKEQIVTLSRRVWNECMMKKNPKFGVEHDMYLKLWEMEGARVSGRFEMVMVDESQDMVPVNINALRKIYGQRICVGDKRQELYGFRDNEDVRKSMAFDHELHLVESKRFGQAIADVANKVQSLLPDTYPPIIGAGGESKVLSGTPKGQYAVLCRSNLGLLSEAIKAIDAGQSIHVIGSLTESIMLMESAWYLFLGESRKVIHPSLRMAGDWETLVELAKEDQEFAMAVKRVEEFRGQIPFICEKVKMSGETSRQRADVVLSTVHKAKGDEFDVVKLGDDFPDLVRFSKKERKYTAMTSEICCFFVAVTRAKRELYANTTLSQLDTWKEWIS